MRQQKPNARKSNNGNKSKYTVRYILVSVYGYSLTFDGYIP